MTNIFRVTEEDGSEPDLEKIALEEPWAKGLMSIDMDGFAITYDGLLVLLDECGAYRYPPEGRFRVERLECPTNIR